MAKIIRFKSADQREWNHNQSMVVNDNGTIVRPVTSKEQLTMFTMTKHVASSNQPFETKTPEENTTIEARLTRLPGSNKSRIDFFIDGMAVKGGRELIKERLLSEHGPCQVYGINGKFLTVVRDPNAVAKKTTAAQGVSQAPSPELCICKNWALPNGATHPGRHHPVCEFNDKAPPEQRGSFNDVGGEAPPVFQQTSAQKAIPLPPPAPKVPSPAECHCKNFAMPDGSVKPADVHHPICEFKEAWESANPTGEKFFIVNLETLAVMREATVEEASQAEAEEAVSGVMTVTIDGTTFGVMTESDLRVATEP
jgi:hypothetical protein